MEEQCLTVMDDTRRGENMFVLGLLTWLYHRDVERVHNEMKQIF